LIALLMAVVQQDPTADVPNVPHIKMQVLEQLVSVGVVVPPNNF
jgi:hypothetical protein